MSCLAIGRGPSPARIVPTMDICERLTVVPCFSTRSPIYRCRCSPSCFGPSNRARPRHLGSPNPSQSISDWSQRFRSLSPTLSERRAFAPISMPDWTASACACRRCESASTRFRSFFRAYCKPILARALSPRSRRLLSKRCAAMTGRTTCGNSTAWYSSLLPCLVRRARSVGHICPRRYSRD